LQIPLSQTTNFRHSRKLLDQTGAKNHIEEEGFG
jgi:hypothetical protein